MKRATITTMILLATALAGSGVAAQDRPERDLPVPGSEVRSRPRTGRPLGRASLIPQYKLAPGRFDPGADPGLWPVAPSMWPTAPTSIDFVMPDRDLFVSHSRFLRQRGITVPAGSVNASRMVESNAGYMPLFRSGNQAFGLTGVRQNFPSLGFSNSLTAGYVWAPTDGITLYGNVRASDNLYHQMRFKDFGVSGRARVEVTDGLWVNGYANYSVYNTATGPLPMGMRPNNSFGGTIEVRLADGIGIEGGVMREYDAFNRRWTTTPYFMPVFY